MARKRALAMNLGLLFQSNFKFNGMEIILKGHYCFHLFDFFIRSTWNVHTIVVKPNYFKYICSNFLRPRLSCLQSHFGAGKFIDSCLNNLLALKLKKYFVFIFTSAPWIVRKLKNGLKMLGPKKSAHSKWISTHFGNLGTDCEVHSTAKNFQKRKLIWIFVNWIICCEFWYLLNSITYWQIDRYWKPCSQFQFQ